MLKSIDGNPRYCNIKRDIVFSFHGVLVDILLVVSCYMDSNVILLLLPFNCFYQLKTTWKVQKQSV